MWSPLPGGDQHVTYCWSRCVPCAARAAPHISSWGCNLFTRTVVFCLISSEVSQKFIIDACCIRRNTSNAPTAHGKYAPKHYTAPSGLLFGSNAAITRLICNECKVVVGPTIPLSRRDFWYRRGEPESLVPKCKFTTVLFYLHCQLQTLQNFILLYQITSNKC